MNPETSTERVVNPRGITHADKMREAEVWALDNWQYATGALITEPISLDLPSTLGGETVVLGETLIDGRCRVEDEAIARADISLAKRTLTRKQRQMIDLMYGANMTVEEVSQTLGIKLATAGSRLRAAMDNLRRYFDIPVERVIYDSRTPQEKRDYQNAWYAKKKAKQNEANI